MTKIIDLTQIQKSIQDIDVVAAMEEGFIAYSNGDTAVPSIGELLFEKN